MKLIQQAVLLCGGLGTRLRPMTDNIPKPMVPVDGRPFLHYLLDQLAGQEIKQFVLLTGYLGEQIFDYFDDGSKFGWRISYSNGPADWDTGRRIWEARSLFNPTFLLLYSDNFVQFKLNKLQALHDVNKTPISLLLAPKEKGNISVSKSGSITGYDKDRNGEGFDFVEVGYMIIERDQVLKEFSSCESFPDFNFSAILKKFANQQLINGLIVRDAYHSISDSERWKMMCDYLHPQKILLIDRDGTINIKAAKGEYITTWGDFEFVPETYAAMKLLSAEGFRFIIITNQAGIARGKMAISDLERIHSNMIKQLASDGIEILKIYYSPHHWEENSFMRKPQPGMFFEASKEFRIRLDKTLYIGDDSRDCQAGYNAGCPSIFIGEADELKDLKDEEKPLGVFPDMFKSIAMIRNFYKVQTEGTSLNPINKDLQSSAN